MKPVAKRSLVTGDVDLIYNEVLILPDARLKIRKLKFTSAIKDVIAAVERILGGLGWFGWRDYWVRIADVTIIHLHNQYFGANNKGGLNRSGCSNKESKS